MKIADYIECPKCRTKSLMSVLPPEFGREYFCIYCCEYFGVNELVNRWNYDAGDLFPSCPVTFGNYKGWLNGELPENDVPFAGATILECDFNDIVGEDYEPSWLTQYERDDAYFVVNRMFLGIDEIDDYADLIATQEEAVDRGIQ